MFENIEPNFTEENGELFYIWINLKMPLDTSKKQGCNALKSKKNPKEIQKKSKQKPKTNQTKTNNISTFLFLISNFNYLDRGLLRGKIEEWLRYKEERKEIYKETGLKSLLTQIEKNSKKYGDEAVINLIDESMANNWKGIIWDKLKNKKEEQLPEWFGENIEEIKITKEDREELERMINKWN